MFDVSYIERVEQHGMLFRIAKLDDNDHGAPWENEDNHGDIRRDRVSHGERGSKKPWERPMNQPDRHEYQYYYDWRETMAIAKADGWGLGDEALAKLKKTLGREPTKGDILHAAVESDFKRMAGWVTNEWHYIGVQVTRLDENGEDAEAREIWCIESDGDDWEEAAAQLIEEISHDHLRENREVEYWEQRGIVTTGIHLNPYL